MSTPVPLRSGLVVLLVASGGSGAPAMAQESVSAPLPAELSSLMTEQQLEAVAGKDTVDVFDSSSGMPRLDGNPLGQQMLSVQ